MASFTHAELTITKVDYFDYVLSVDGKEVLSSESQFVEVSNHWQGSNATTYLVAFHSGGIACPAIFRIIEIGQDGRKTISEEFGSCSDLVYSSQHNGQVRIEVPFYSNVGRFEEWSQERIDELYNQAVPQVFVWSDGKVEQVKYQLMGVDSKVYDVSFNKHGAVINRPDFAGPLYLGVSCDAYSKEIGSGRWYQQGSSVTAQFDDQALEFQTIKSFPVVEPCGP